jgi:DNA polymerase III psi subunit
MNSISVNSKYLRNIEEGEIDVIFNKNSIIHIFLIGRKSSMRLHDSDVTIKLLPSLSEMLSNPDKKKKLWHDIQSSLNGEMKGNN